MHISAVVALEDSLIPSAERLIAAFRDLEAANPTIVKSGRTHLQDAVPIKFCQEISGWRSSLEKDVELVRLALEPLKTLALGGTAVGTGLNAPKGFDVQVIGNDTAIGMAASQGNFELNVFMPVIAYNFLQSVRLLSESMESFRKNCVVGIRANEEKMHHNLYNSLMLVTALNPYIGYEKAAKTAHLAFEENISLKDACVKLGFLTPERFDEVFHPEDMAN